MAKSEQMFVFYILLHILAKVKQMFVFCGKILKNKKRVKTPFYCRIGDVAFVLQLQGQFIVVSKARRSSSWVSEIVPFEYSKKRIPNKTIFSFNI